jgi:hypothetical protein
MSAYRYQSLGPLLAGEGSRAYLGLAISDDQRARPVVIIWVPESAKDDAELMAKIRRETEHAAKLDHPNIVTVLGFATLPEGSARVVEFADGESLRRIIDTAGKLPPRIAAKIVADACTGTHYAHIAGNDDGSSLVHGDLRPETVLISFTGVTKVTGYGALVFAPREAGGRRVKGRRIHCAPEQLIGGRGAITVPTDVYLLGLTLYECMTGVVPWTDQGDFFDHAVLTLPMPPATPGLIPPALESVILKACAKRANDRYANPLAMREAIESAMGSELASNEELSAYLESLFPQAHELRAERRHTIDAGIADFVRRQWAERDRTETTPMMRAVEPAAAPAPTQPPPPQAALPPPPVPARPAPAVTAPPDEDEPRRDGESPWPWVLFLAAFVAVIVGWWAWSRRVDPTPPIDEPIAALADVVDAAVQAPPALDAAVAGGELADASGEALAQADLPDAGPTESVDAGARSAPPPARAEGAPGAGVDPAAIAPPEGDVPVTIASTPSAELFLDGASLGPTPWSGKLPPGKKVFRFENKGALLNAWRSVTVEGAPVSEAFTFEKGLVAITAPEGALVAIDGTRVGTAPITGEVPVYEGNHRISVTFGKAKWSEPFTLYGGQRVSFNVELQ